MLSLIANETDYSRTSSPLLYKQILSMITEYHKNMRKDMDDFSH